MRSRCQSSPSRRRHRLRCLQRNSARNGVAHRAALSNDWAAARALHRKYLPLMQANFIESSPLPVKAVLAMMARSKKSNRLPLLPMRRDTRSRLQKIATEVGLITKPASPAAEAQEFFIYENWAAGPRKIVLHRGSAANAATAKDVPPATTSTTPAGTALRDSPRNPGDRSRHDRRPNPQRVQVRVKEVANC